jgi:hypothetical protein
LCFLFLSAGGVTEEKEGGKGEGETEEGRKAGEAGFKETKAAGKIEGGRGASEEEEEEEEEDEEEDEEEEEEGKNEGEAAGKTEGTAAAAAAAGRGGGVPEARD